MAHIFTVKCLFSEEDIALYNLTVFVLQVLEQDLSFADLLALFCHKDAFAMDAQVTVAKLDSTSVPK